MSDVLTTNEDFYQKLPVLTKEDIVFILEALFKFSQVENNALVRKPDGIYALDFHQNFIDHINDTGIHATNEQTYILDNFTYDDGKLLFQNKEMLTHLSSDEGNAATIREGGVYVPDLSTSLQDHIDDNIPHITQEERDEWNDIYRKAKQYCDNLVESLIIYDYQIISSLPNDENIIKSNVIYLLPQDITDTQTRYYVRYIYRDHAWICLDLLKEVFDTIFVRKKYVDDNFARKDSTYVHTHDNKSVLDRFGINEHDRLLFDGTDIFNHSISNDPTNALYLGSDFKLYVKDLSSELESIARDASMSKTIILRQDCNQSGVYELEENIDNFNFLMIHYYLMPDDPNLQPYDAKMEMVDVDSLEELYDMHIDYIIEHDYGVSTYNTKLRFYDGHYMQITYYNHVCIYKIIGVR